MTYANMAEVMVGVYTKHQKKRDNLKDKLAELKFRKDLLDNAGVMDQQIDKDIDNTATKLANVELEIEIIEKKVNGGASLDRFREKQESED